MYREKHPDRIRQKELIRRLKLKQRRQNSPGFDEICKIRVAKRKRLYMQKKATEASFTSHIGDNVHFEFIPNTTQSLRVFQFKVNFFLLPNIRM